MSEIYVIWFQLLPPDRWTEEHLSLTRKAVSEINAKHSKVNIKPFSHCISYPQEIQPQRGPGGFYTTVNLAQFHTVPMKTRLRISVALSPGFRTQISHYGEVD